MAAVKLYTSDWCGYCSAAKRLLEKRGIAYDEIDLSGRPEERQRLAARTGMRTVPQVFVGDRHVGGYTELSALDRAGGLAALVAEAEAER